MMSPRTEAQLEQHKRAKQTIILMAAMEVFAKKGYDGASISQIATQAGVAKGLIYNYFPSKEELLIATIMSGFEQMGDVGSEDQVIVSLADFENYVTKMFQMIELMPNYWKVYFGMFFQPQVLGIISQRIGNILDPFMLLFTNYYSIRGCENPETHARIFIAFLDGIGMHLLYMPDKMDKELIIKTIVERFG